jgi:hypothetical protein
MNNVIGTRRPYRDHTHANIVAPATPRSAPVTSIGVCWICSSSSAVSIPSRLIIRLVKRKTPAKAAAPARSLDVRRRPSIAPFIWRPARHMCIVITATDTAAMIASGPSSHSWLVARYRANPPIALTAMAAMMPQ